MLNRKFLAVTCITLGLILSYAAVQAQEPDETPEPTGDEVLPMVTETPDEAAESPEGTESEVEAAEPEPSNAYCLLCHSKSGQVWELPSGESVSVTIDPAVLENSVHGAANPEGTLNCADCHTGMRFPHQTPAAQTLRQFTLERYGSCRTCHEDQYLHAQDSVHGEALRNGQIAAAVCVDCHGSHDIQPPDEPRERISLTCAQCHGAIFQAYSESVHGLALLRENDPNVPTCIDCHGVHNIEDPTTSEFRTASPEVCAKCHANKEMMSEYPDISTHVFETYLSDFHGTTVALFEDVEGGHEVETNTAVCFDCHGVHNIASEDMIQSIRENLVETCRQCHLEIDANNKDFSDAWIGHYPPTADENRMLASVNTLYDFLLPVGGGLIAVFILLDIIRRIQRRA